MISILLLIIILFMYYLCFNYHNMYFYYGANQLFICRYYICNINLSRIKDHSIINVIVRSPLYNNFVSYIPHAKSLTSQKC